MVNDRPLILAVHAGHNAGACIGGRDGLIFAAQEERYKREKNYWGFPERAIQACLDAADARSQDIAVIASGGRQILSRYRSRHDVLASYRRMDSPAGQLRQRILVPVALKMYPNWGQRRFAQQLEDFGLGGVPVSRHDHHTAHAATAYYGLRKNLDDRFLVLTCDGDGDDLCATVRIMQGAGDEVVAKTHWSNSLGAVYSWVTFSMGFVPLEHEYKLMGMAPYASVSAAEQTAGVFARYLALDASGLQFRRRTWRRMIDLAAALRRDLEGVRFDHICAGLQTFTEDLLTRWAAHAVERTGVPDVLASGGVFMNVKANKRIAELDAVDSFEAFPSCGDETLCLGAFYLESARRFGQESVKPLDSFYLGGTPHEKELRTLLEASGFRFTRLSDPAAEVAEILAAGQPVARCAGAMEFGARALGNRSILADPAQPDVVRVINRMIKKRDFWMPFAPIIKQEGHQRYLVNTKGLRSPYMMMTFDTRDNFKEMIAAVHSADLTSRAQILTPEQNPEMYSILDAFEARTGRGVLLNTSFNLHGYPIVRTGEDALDVFTKSGLTHLQLGPFLVHKD